MNTLARGVSLVGVMVAISSCSVDDARVLFGEPQAGQGGAAGSGGRGEGPGSTSGGLGGDATTTSTSAQSTAASTSASSTVSASSMAASSSTGEPPGAEVYCKNQPCAAGQICCFHFSDPNQDHCGGSGTCGDQYLELTCNSPDDCPGQVCCGDHDGQTYTGVYCQPTCNGPGKITMCFDDPGVCNGAPCTQSGYLGGGYAYCDN